MSQANDRCRRVSYRTTPGRLFLTVTGGGLGALLILLPVAAVFHHALRDGWPAYLDHLAHASTVHAIQLSLSAAGTALLVNTVFGLSAAWLASKFEFRGRNLLVSVIELPLSLSPIIIGSAFLFVFGMQGLFGPWLAERGVKLVFNPTAIVIVTTIVTAPFVFKQVLPLMQAQGRSAEETAATLGASGGTMFFRVTLPGVKWALIYGMSLCFARALGEFGSVAVVSGSVRGRTNTMALQIELLFNDRSQTGAFAVASLLTWLAILTLGVKTWMERLESRDMETRE